MAHVQIFTKTRHLIKHETCKNKKTESYLAPGNLGIYTHELLLNMEPY